MKKLLLCVALLAGMTFMACSSDDDNKSTSSNCTRCTVTIQTQSQTFDVCKGDNGNAYVSNMDTSTPYDTYIDQMCD